MGEQGKMFVGLCLCSTGLELDVKEQVRKVVVACGGRFEDDLDPATTTHLVADAVGSRKHRAAVAHELPVTSPRWVFESFRAQKLLDVKDFGLRLLEGMGICTAGLAMEEKEKVAQLASTNGAQYAGTLELGFTDVLIARHPEGAKYEAAVANDIPVVHLGWLMACLEREMVVDEEEFTLRPEAENPSLQPTFIAVNQQKDAQELVAALPEVVTKYRRVHKEDRDEEEQEEEAAEDEWMDLFDGCVLHLLGFPPQMNALLQRLIRAGMGTIYHNVVVRQVTHVVVSASLSEKQTLEAIRARVIAANAADEVHFVSASWLIDCVKCLDLQPEELYPVEFDVHVRGTAPGTGASTFLDGEINVGVGFPPAEKYTEAENEMSSDPVTLSEDLLQNDDGNSILAETTPSQKRTSIFAGYSFLLLCRDPDDRHMIRPMLKNIQGEKGGAEAIALAAIDFTHVDPEQFSFISHAVVCTGVAMDEQEALKMQERIHQIQRELRRNEADADEAEGAGVDDAHDRPRKRARPDKKPRQRMLQFVSDLWVNCSLAARTKLSYASHELFGVSTNRPRALFTSPVPLPGFQDVIASTSVYRAVEQLVVIELLRIAGAHVTRKLSTQNTHLICRKSIGVKFAKALKCGLHIVKARWVVDSLLQGQRLSEDSPDFEVADEDERSSYAHAPSEETILSQSSPRSAST
ncbi:hypothetical protein PHYPSEUDO_010969 [Phytophthora pseudosyringae]|uniref:BRCT domain-containing protein n=1 Tax=Phytophthora pseudosyringae TaxID=221518 RepID=A0A8T1W6S9_9STRA|nr:hypothetical protein PHYPSEUDO_010969 [Phytophthora pseudosyringae]